MVSWVIPKIILLKNQSNCGNLHVALPNNHNKKYIIESLDFLNIKYLFYQDNYTIIARKFTHVTLTAQLGNFRPSLIQQFIHYFKIDELSKPFRKIYISREKAPKRKVINEDKLIDILIKYQYNIYYFEDMSFEEQIRLMNETKTIISLHGAGLTNMVFMQQKSNVFELRLYEDKHMNLFYSLANASNLNYFYQLCKGDGDNNDIHEQNVHVDLKKFEQIYN